MPKASLEAFRTHCDRCPHCSNTRAPMCARGQHLLVGHIRVKPPRPAVRYGLGMGILSLIVTMLPSLINIAELAYAHKAKPSSAKLNVVLTGARKVAQVLVTDGIDGHKMPTDEDLITAIELQLVNMKAARMLVSVVPLAPRAA